MQSCLLLWQQVGEWGRHGAALRCGRVLASLPGRFSLVGRSHIGGQLVVDFVGEVGVVVECRLDLSRGEPKMSTARPMRSSAGTSCPPVRR